MRILITGGAGFIGSNFIRYILNKYPHYTIINLDNLTYCGNLDNLRDIDDNPNYRFVKGDICDSNVVSGLAKDCDVIINFAAESIAEDTYLPIWTVLGIRIYSFEELFRNLSRRNKVKVHNSGIEVIDLNNENIKALAYKGGIGYWMPIKQISRHKYKGKIIHLHQKWGEVKATPNHSIYDANFRIISPKTNPELLGLRNINHISKKRRYKSYTGRKLRALVSILGAYVSEGWSSFNKANGSYLVGIANKNKDWIDSLKNNFRLLGYNPSITRTKGDAYQLVISNKNFFNFIRKEAGHIHHGKKIPDFIFNLERFYQEDFLKNIVFGDGETIKNKNYKTIRYVTTSKKLATGLSLLLTLLKYNYSIAKDRRFNAYSLNFGGDYTISLLNRNYEEIDYEGYVYDVSVKRLHNFACGVGNIVVHNTHVDRSILGPESFIKTNIYGIFTLLEVAKRYKIERVVQISTDETYGSIERGSFRETDSLSPSSPYAASKASADLLCLSYFATYNLPVIITRSSNNFGPFQYPEKVVPLFITNALENKRLPLYGDGLNVRDWLYVIDNCKAMDLVLHKGKIGEIYNIGAGNERTNLELTRMILKLLKQSEHLIEYVKDRPGHDRRYSVECTKIKKLGWEPSYDFEEAMEETIDWYRSRQEWWKKIKEKRKEYQKYYQMQYGEKR